MNKSYKSTVESIIIALFILCSFNVFAEQPPQINSTKLVQMVFVDRAKKESTFSSGGVWDLDNLQRYFDPVLKKESNRYLTEQNTFYKKYGKYSNSITRLNDFVQVSQFDPITGCDRPPTDASVREIHRTQSAVEYQVIYKIFGTRAFYKRSILIKLQLEEGQWLITDVEYKDPAIPLLNQDQSIHGMLKFMAKELHASVIWASLNLRTIKKLNSE